MAKENSNDFILLLQDEKFLDLVKHTDGLGNQLDVLERAYPGQREAIFYAVEFLKVNLSKSELMVADDASRIWRVIIEQSAQNKGNAFRKIFFHDLWKVAAIFIVILASSILVYHRLSDTPLVKIAVTKPVVTDEAMLILSDGTMHKLSKNDSHIEYSSDGGSVVVKDDMEEEKIDNFHTSKTANLNQIIVPYGHRHIATLSDGTRVQLNSGSQLVFPAEFSGKSREVYLRGEGYFEVFKDGGKPFIVKTDFFDTKVLGTVFNISAYDDEQFASAVLVEGKIVVLQKNKLIGDAEKILTPGQGCFYSSATEISEIRNIDVYDYISWKDGLFLFKDKPLNNIIRRVEKYYNKKILIEEGELPDILISGKLVLSDDIELVMAYLTKTLVARYEKNEEGNYTIKSLHNNK